MSMQWRINRNIVECKEMIDQYHRKGKNVLIETLWNVKKDIYDRLPVC